MSQLASTIPSPRDRHNERLLYCPDCGHECGGLYWCPYCGGPAYAPFAYNKDAPDDNTCCSFKDIQVFYLTTEQPGHLSTTRPRCDAEYKDKDERFSCSAKLYGIINKCVYASSGGDRLEIVYCPWCGCAVPSGGICQYCGTNCKKDGSRVDSFVRHSQNPDEGYPCPDCGYDTSGFFPCENCGCAMG